MSDKKFLEAAGAALMIAVVLTLVLAPAARATATYRVLHRFKGADGANPYASLVFDAAGNLYGTTYYGGAHNVGTVFKLTPSADGSWKESVLHSFNNSDGANPDAGLIFDAAGNLYGTTLNYGPHGDGTVFKLTPSADGSWKESVLHSFNFSDGANPDAGLIFDAAGNLYGTTAGGGADSQGTVFRLTPPNGNGSWTERVLYSFNGSDGQYPLGGVIFDAAGNLYGTTPAGGASKQGTVFKLAPNADGSWTESVLNSFNGSDGIQPEAGLIFDAAGNLYGTTTGGGASGYGAAFKLAPNADGSWTERVLYSFNGIEGDDPTAGLIFDGAGNLYGAASRGGRVKNSGVTFKLSPNHDGSWTYSLLHVFKGKPARFPAGGLVLNSAGALYGTTADCINGSGCLGVVYEITP